MPIFCHKQLSRTLTIRLKEQIINQRKAIFMAISRDKKNTLVAELTELFASAKGTAGATYTTLTVADLQELRASARENGVTIKIAKNRLVRVALSLNDKYKAADTSLLTGQLVYAFSDTDEVAPAQVLAKFAKKHPALALVAGFDGAGASLDTATVTALASLPTKDQLRGQLVSVIAAPLTGFLGVANGAQRGFAQVLSQRAQAL
jgi:large subunit ribosomal protein L10